MCVCVRACVRACAGAYVWWDGWGSWQIEWRLVLSRKDPLGGGDLKSESEVASRSFASDSLRPHGHQALPSMGFSRHEYWSGLPFPSPGNFPTQGSNPCLLRCIQTLYRLNHQESGGGLERSKTEAGRQYEGVR